MSSTKNPLIDWRWPHDGLSRPISDLEKPLTWSCICCDGRHRDPSPKTGALEIDEAVLLTAPRSIYGHAGRNAIAPAAKRRADTVPLPRFAAKLGIFSGHSLACLDHGIGAGSLEAARLLLDSPKAGPLPLHSPTSYSCGTT